MKATRALPRTAATALLVGLGAMVPYVVPAADRLRLVSPREVARAAGAFRGEPRAPLVRWNESLPAPPETIAPVPARVERQPAKGARALVRVPVPAVPIEDPAGALDRFFEKVSAVEAGGSETLARLTHLGDSPLTGDLISGEARKMLQAELGDGGPGFVLAARPWDWYGHDGVRIEASGWTATSPLLGDGNDGHHGLGLVSFTGGSPAARSEVLCERGSFRRAEVTFTAAPGGGTLLVSLDGGDATEVPTSAPAKRTGRFVAEAPAGATRVTLRPKGDGDVTVYGVALEKDGPGLVYDAVGANGASVYALNRLDEKGWEEALALRGSDLVILNYGTNESSMEGIGGPRYAREYAEAIGRVRRALPSASILVMAPMDRGVRLADGSVGTMPSVLRLVAAQRRVARENACAFFDTFAAMGGEGTMGRWYGNEPRLVSGDFTHPTKAGSNRVARLFVGALRSSRAAWEARREKAARLSAVGAAASTLGVPSVTPPPGAAPPPS